MTPLNGATAGARITFGDETDDCHLDVLMDPKLDHGRKVSWIKDISEELEHIEI